MLDPVEDSPTARELTAGLEPGTGPFSKPQLNLLTNKGSFPSSY